MIHALRLIWPIFLLSFLSQPRDGKLLGEIRHYSRNVINAGGHWQGTLHVECLYFMGNTFFRKTADLRFFSMTFKGSKVKKVRRTDFPTFPPTLAARQTQVSDFLGKYTRVPLFALPDAPNDG